MNLRQRDPRDSTTGQTQIKAKEISQIVSMKDYTEKEPRHKTTEWQ